MMIVHAVIAKASCNAACERAAVNLARLLFRLCWGYLHYWTFAIIGLIAAIAGWLRFRSGD